MGVEARVVVLRIDLKLYASETHGRRRASGFPDRSTVENMVAVESELTEIIVGEVVNGTPDAFHRGAIGKIETFELGLLVDELGS